MRISDWSSDVCSSDLVQVFGTDYETRDGTCIRDYVHVCDLADAHLRALEYSRQQPGFHKFNLGNGAGYTVLEVLGAAESVVGREQIGRASCRESVCQYG